MIFGTFDIFAYTIATEAKTERQRDGDAPREMKIYGERKTEK